MNVGAVIDAAGSSAGMEDFVRLPEMDSLTAELAASEGVTERLKAENQMAWVGQMNNIRQRAEEIIMAELIYS